MDEQVFDKIQDIAMDKEMRRSYLDYSMSVIVGRALPDVRDGLKPVHRRILFSMHENGLTAERQHRKSATVVGDVLGKYHPHGDSSVYDAMVKLAQPFAIRYPLINGQGNFGSVDGDSAAAMRYTEAKMTKIAQEMLRDIDKNTVNFSPNFDERLKEPNVLPARYPNLLVNGSNGIAVGMATSIPPHNLREVIDAVIELIDNEEATVEDLMKHIEGPDFPTGASIIGRRGIDLAYRTGRGKVLQRAKSTVEEMGGGKMRIVVTEIPYQVNKAKMVEKIADLVRNKRVDGITGLRDESSRKGMRVVIELRRDVNPTILLNQLYKMTPLQQTYSIIFLAVVDGRPMVCNLYEMLRFYLDYQIEVVTRRTQFDLDKAMARAHILEGLLIAIDNIDEVIAIIRSSYSDAQERLMERFGLSDKQAQAILEMRLRRLQGLERDNLQKEFAEVQESIIYLSSLLADKQLLMNVIKEELREIKDKHGDDRRTEFLESEEEIDILDLIEDEEVSITLTKLNYIKRVTIDSFKTQRRGGRGIASMSTRDEDYVEKIVQTTNHSKLALLSNQGRLYRLNAYEVPESSRTSRGENLVNLIKLEENERICAMLPYTADMEERYLVICSKLGIVKKTSLKEFQRSNRNGIVAMALKEGDEVLGAATTSGNDKIMLITRNAKAINFEETDLRALGRNSIGVRGLRLDKDDEIIAMEVYDADKDLLIISENGYGKRTSASDYKTQLRGGKGYSTYKITKKTGRIAGAKLVSEEEELMIVNTDGTLIRVRVADISVLSKVTSGVTIMKMQSDARVSSFVPIEAEEEETVIETEEE